MNAGILKEEHCEFLISRRYWGSPTWTGRYISNKWKHRTILAKGAASKNFNHDLAQPMLILTSPKCIFRKHLLPSGELWRSNIRGCWHQSNPSLLKTYMFYPVGRLNVSQRTTNDKAIFKFDVAPNIPATLTCYLLCIQDEWKYIKHFENVL